MRLSEEKSWSVAYARQALSDLEARDVLLEARPALPRCHELHFLQMATEKLCKAHLVANGNGVVYSHQIIQRTLPILARQFGGKSLSSDRLKLLKRVGAEIERLSPQVRDAGARPDNSEYPWSQVDGTVLAPCDAEFPGVAERDAGMLIKLLRLAAADYASAASPPPPNLQN